MAQTVSVTVSEAEPLISVASTAVEMTELLDGAQCSEGGVLSTGLLLKWMDLCACMAAEKFSGRSSVTAAMDDVRFVAPLRKGEAAVLRAQVNRAFATSMEVGCRVSSEDLATGRIRHCVSAYFTFVAILPDGSKAKLPHLPIPIEEDGDNRRRYAEAGERRRIRLERRDMVANTAKALSDQKSGAQSPSLSAAECAPGLLSPSSSAGSLAPPSPKLPAHRPQSSVDAVIAAMEALASPRSRASGSSTPSSSDRGSGSSVPSGPSSTGPEPLAQKKASLSLTKMTELVLPTHANHMGNAFGGQTMAWMQEAAMVAALRITRKPVALASIDDIHFFCPIRVGDRVSIIAQVNRSFSHSLEVGVKVHRYALGTDPVHALSAYMIFKLADDAPLVFEAVPNGPEETRRFHEAMGRRRVRLTRKTIVSHGDALSFPWSPENAAQLIYSNVRGLLMVHNKSVFAKQSEWEVVKKDPAEDMELLMSHGTNNITCLLLKSHIRNATAEQVFEAVMDLDRRKQWDIVIEVGSVVERYDERNDVIRLVFRTQGTAPPLEFVLLRSWRQLEGEAREFVVSNRSVFHEKVPQQPQYQRGEVLSSGFLIKPGAAGGVELSYIVQMGARALNLAVGDIVGDSARILQSFKRLQALFAPQS